MVGYDGDKHSMYAAICFGQEFGLIHPELSAPYDCRRTAPLSVGAQEGANDQMADFHKVLALAKPLPCYSLEHIARCTIES